MKATLFLSILTAIILASCIIMSVIYKVWSVTFSTSFMFLLEVLLSFKIYKLIKRII